jgi:hypothetical protein
VTPTSTTVSLSRVRRAQVLTGAPSTVCVAPVTRRVSPAPKSFSLPPPQPDVAAASSSADAAAAITPARGRLAPAFQKSFISTPRAQRVRGSRGRRRPRAGRLSHARDALSMRRGVPPPPAAVPRKRRGRWVGFPDARDEHQRAGGADQGHRPENPADPPALRDRAARDRRQREGQAADAREPRLDPPAPRSAARSFTNATDTTPRMPQHSPSSVCTNSTPSGPVAGM